MTNQFDPDTWLGWAIMDLPNGIQVWPVYRTPLAAGGIFISNTESRLNKTLTNVTVRHVPAAVCKALGMGAAVFYMLPQPVTVDNDYTAIGCFIIV